MGTLSEKKLAAIIMGAVAVYMEAEERDLAPEHRPASGEAVKGQKSK